MEKKIKNLFSILFSLAYLDIFVYNRGYLIFCEKLKYFYPPNKKLKDKT